MERRFGIPERLFDDFLLLKRKTRYRLLRRSPFLHVAAQLKISTAGLKAFHLIGRYIKPTTRFIQLFGRTASGAKLNLVYSQLQKISRGEAIPIHTDLENGYVILCMDNRPLGLGLLIDGMLRSQIPTKDRHFFLNEKRP